MSDTVTLTAVVYRPGYNRKGVSFSDEALERIAATGENRPILFQHDPLLEEGVVKGVSVEDGALVADLSFDGEKALASLGRGVEPRFSIRPQPEDGAQLVCLKCDSDQLTGGCIHPWKGGGVEARGPWELAEISRTPTPAVPGTGVRAFLTELAEVVDPGVRRQWEIAMSDTDSGGVNAPAIAQTEPEDQPEAQVVNLADREKMVTMAAQIAELKESILLERARRLAVESREVVLASMKRGALRCEEQAGIELRARDPELFDAIVALVPDNIAFTAGARLAPVSEETPDQTVDPHDYVALAARVERLSRESGESYETVLKRERQKMHDLALGGE